MAESVQVALPLLVAAREAARLCGVGRTLWLQLASAGRVPMPVRLGRRTLWQREELKAWTAAGCPGRERWEVLAAARPGRRWTRNPKFAAESL